MTEIDINRTHRLPTEKAPKGILKVAVIGGNGFLGRHFISKLAKKYTNLDIHSLDKNEKAIYIDTTGFKSPVNQVNMPVHVPGTIQPWLWANQPDIIVFMAGAEGPASGLNRPSRIAEDLEASVALTNTLEYMSDIRPAYFLYVSSCAVYGNQGKKPLTESSSLKPENSIGQIRLAAEQVVEQYCTAMEHQFCIVRPSEIFGRHHNKELSDSTYWPGYIGYYVNEVVTKLDYKLRHQEDDIKLNLLFSQRAQKDFVHVDYVCEVLEHLCVHRLPGINNISSGQVLSLGEVFNLVLNTISEHPALPYEDFQRLKLPLNKENLTKTSNSLIVSSSSVREMVPYDAQRYQVSTFMENYLPIRMTEVRQQKDYEDAVLRTQVLDTTGHYRGV